MSVCIPLMHIADILFTPPPPAPCFKTSSLCLPGLHLRFPRGSLVTRAGLVEWNSAGAGLASAGSAWMLMLPGERMQGEAGAAGGGAEGSRGLFPGRSCPGCLGTQTHCGHDGLSLPPPSPRPAPSPLFLIWGGGPAPVLSRKSAPPGPYSDNFFPPSPHTQIHRCLTADCASHWLEVTPCSLLQTLSHLSGRSYSTSLSAALQSHPHPVIPR